MRRDGGADYGTEVQLVWASIVASYSAEVYYLAIKTRPHLVTINCSPMLRNSQATLTRALYCSASRSLQARKRFWSTEKPIKAH